MVTRQAAGRAVEIEGVRLTHPGRVLYPAQGITKRDLALYYQTVAPWLMPHVAGRPLSLVRCPAGEGGACFYQKHFERGLPDGLTGVDIAEKAGRATYAMVEELRGLVALVQLGVLELHPWGATAARLETPDRMIFDLDPDPEMPWPDVVAAAVELRDLLAGMGFTSFAKTTGGKGLHVMVPVTPQLDWERFRAAARAIAVRLAERAPRRYTVELPKAARRHRIFVDYLRNSRGQTAVAPYSPRARAGAPVATPLAWDEVMQALRPDRFTVATLPRRLESLSADPWAGMAKLRQRFSAALLRTLGV